MTPEGWKTINETLSAGGIEDFTVSPKPRAGEDLRQVTISARNVTPDMVNTLLKEAGLMWENGRPEERTTAPRLQPFEATAGQKPVVARIKYNDANAVHGE